MLITDEYRYLMSDAHKQYPTFGRSAPKYKSDLTVVIGTYGPTSILDYGCGKGELSGVIRKINPAIPVTEYDPGIPEKAEMPGRADMVIALDVLEHIEPKCLYVVLEHIRSLADRYFLATIATRPAKKVLADGRNAHLIIEPAEYWLDLLYNDFVVIESRWDEGEVFFIGAPRQHEGST